VTPAIAFCVLSAAACPASAPTPDSPGLSGVARLPATEAMRLNGEGKQLYRQQRWEEAWAKYAAALAVDPDFLSARLNIACSYARQGHYAESAQEAARLIRQSFVPWSREVLEAVDLGILQGQAVYATVERARTEAARAWGAEVQDGIFFLARTKPPVNVEGEGTLVLALNQELFAWIPRTGRYFQLSAEDGRVLAFAVSADGRRVAYLLAGKVVRRTGQAPLLRGLSLRVLDIPPMRLGVKVPISDEVRQVQLWFASSVELKITDATGASKGFRLMDQELVATSGATPPSRVPSVVLSPSGVAPSGRRVDRKGCAFSLATRKGADGVWRIEVSPPGSKPFVLDTRYGAGLDGLPFPEAAEKNRPK
jgi:hypothetical protein